MGRVYEVNMKWPEKYGPVLHVRVFTRRIIVLNSSKSVIDLSESRSNIYSDRPVVWMYKELVGHALEIRFVQARHAGEVSGAAGTIFGCATGLIEMRAKSSLTMLEEYPGLKLTKVHRNAGSNILKLAYGWQVKDENDYLVTLMKESIAVQEELIAPGKWLVDTFPWIRSIPSWFPGGGFHIKAEKYRENLTPIDRFPHAWVKEQMASGNYIPPFTSMQLQENLSEEGDDIVLWTAVALYAGGADTTVSATTSFFLVMTLYPEVQKRAQDELDQVMGQDRLPHIKDRKQLIYVQALLKEIMRWAPVVPLQGFD